MPARPPSAAPAEVADGGVLTISSPAFDCDARYPVGTTYDLSLSVAGRREPVPLGSSAVDEDGSFDAEVAVPAIDFPGEAYVSVTAAVRGAGDDGERSCAGYGVLITLLPAS